MIWILNIQRIKSSKFAAFLLLILFKQTFCFAEEPLQVIDDFGSNPGNLKMFFYTASVNDTSSKPLVIVLHGCSQNASDVAKLSGWNKIASQQNFVVLYPQQKALNNPNLCFNWFNKNDITKGEGECESIFQMIEYARKHLHINAERVYITGLSAGAAMSTVMISTYPDRFQSAAIFAGGPYGMAHGAIDAFKMMEGKLNFSQKTLIEQVKNQNPNYVGKYPSLIIYQGLNDNIVDYKNADLLIRQWTGVLDTDTIPDNIQISFNGIKDITRIEYYCKPNLTCVWYYMINNLGHKLLIKPGSEAEEGGQLGLFGADKGFHSTFQTAKDFGLIASP